MCNTLLRLRVRFWCGFGAAAAYGAVLVRFSYSSGAVYVRFFCRHGAELRRSMLVSRSSPNCASTNLCDCVRQTATQEEIHTSADYRIYGKRVRLLLACECILSFAICHRSVV